jgi:hypothetical protein
MPGADEAEIEAAARALLRVILDRLDLLTFKPDPGLLPRALSAAGLARCLALTDAIDKLEGNGRADVAGALGRLVLEAHHVALYALLGGGEALQELAADHAFYVGKIVGDNANVWDEDAQTVLDTIVDDWGEQRVLPFTTLRDKLQAKLNESKHPTDLGTWYSLLYRGESTFNVHGLGQINRYVDMDSEPWRLILNPSPVSARGSFTVAVVLTGHLAWWVFDHHGIGTDALDERSAVLQAAMA